MLLERSRNVPKMFPECSSDTLDSDFDFYPDLSRDDLGDSYISGQIGQECLRLDPQRRRHG